CVDAWASSSDELFARLTDLLEPTARTLAERAFILGRKPTLADAALYGQMAMLDFGAPDRVAALAPSLLEWKARLEERLGPPPYGRIARAYRSLADIQQAFDEASAAARRPSLGLIVLRPATHERLCPEEAVLDPEIGVVGDRFVTSNGKPGAQVAIMDVRI